MKIECTVKELMAELQEWYERGKAEGGVLVHGLTNGEGPLDALKCKENLDHAVKIVRKLRSIITEIRDANLAWCAEGRLSVVNSENGRKVVGLLDSLQASSEAIEI